MENQTILNPIQREIPNQPSKRFPILSIVLVFISVLLLLSTAFLTYQNIQLQKQITSLKTIAPVTPQPTPDPTENWKTYTNTSLKIQFSYPGSWMIRGFDGDQNDESTFTSFSIEDKSSPNIYINVGRNNDSSLTSIPVIQDGQVKLMSTSTQTIGDIVFEKQIFNSYFNSSPKEVDTSVSLKNESKNLVLSYPEPTNVESKMTIDQILSTFRFLSEPSKCLPVEDPCNPQSCDYDLSKCIK